MTVNATWHKKHPLKKGAPDTQRLRWHLAHQKHCACRPIPPRLEALARATSADLADQA